MLTKRHNCSDKLSGKGFKVLKALYSLFPCIPFALLLIKRTILQLLGKLCLTVIGGNSGDFPFPPSIKKPPDSKAPIPIPDLFPLSKILPISIKLKFRSNNFAIEIGIDHKEYSHKTKFTEKNIKSLSLDFN